MEAFILASLLSCSEGAWLLEGLNRSNFEISQVHITEIRLTFIEAMPDNCTPEEYDPPGRK